MIKCPHCGVELAENANFCSLCGEPLLEKNEDNLAFIETRKKSQDEKLITDYQKLSGIQKRKIIRKISAIILFSGILITLVIDFVGNNSITWSKYSATVSLVLFINIAMVTFWLRRYFLWGSLSFVSASLLLVLLDIYSGDIGWAMSLGIPLLFAGYTIVFSLFWLIHRSKQKGLNVIAWSILGIGLFSICTDGVIALYLDHARLFGWSLIVMVSSTIISALLLYIHYRLKKVTDLRRFFHI
ncbi:DUF6320 domain-containing protein [Marinilabilia rubra]|uniref:Zinc ribbon domain-containing protein n=1 Tax=Marinilabilia rubra TaxID=2162893 RepID=A0A2U2B8Q8_9BACT|nr:zinc ribbon domain-containing protein [Marinilabilia rubra]PWD99450.1 zinc ribbon domain-containing protein [Marinilabilia rubra]